MRVAGSVLVALMAILSLTPAVAVAQSCEGRPSFAAGMVQVGAGAAFSDGVQSFAGGLGLGAHESVYGGAVIGTTSLDALDASSFDVGGSLGYQVPLDRAGAVQLCPVGDFTFSSGPNDIAGTGIDLSQWSLQFGLNLGAAIPIGGSARSTVDLVPHGGLAVVHAKAKLEDSFGSTIEGSDTFGLLGLGLSFVFSDRVGVGPSVSIPLGLEGSDATFGVTASVNFGTPR